MPPLPGGTSSAGSLLIRSLLISLLRRSISWCGADDAGCGGPRRRNRPRWSPRRSIRASLRAGIARPLTTWLPSLWDRGVGQLGDSVAVFSAAWAAPVNGRVGVVLHYRVRLDHGAMSTGKFAGAVASHLGVVQALGDVLAGTGKTFGNGPDPTCDPKRDAAITPNPPSAVARAVVGYTERGVRTMLVTIPYSPHVHSGSGAECGAVTSVGYLPSAQSDTPNSFRDLLMIPPRISGLSTTSATRGVSTSPNRPRWRTRFKNLVDPSVDGAFPHSEPIRSARGLPWRLQVAAVGETVNQLLLPPRSTGAAALDLARRPCCPHRRGPAPAARRPPSTRLGPNPDAGGPGSGRFRAVDRRSSRHRRRKGTASRKGQQVRPSRPWA